MQDEFGRPLSDDGQWVWDGSAWRPTGTQGGPAGPGTGGLDPTRVAPADYQPTGGQPAQGDYYAQPPSQQPQGPYGPSGPTGPGGTPPPVPFYKKPSVIIGALLVALAVLVTILVLTQDNGNGKGAVITPSPTTAPPTTTPPPTTPPPTTPPPTTPPPTTPPPTTPPPTTPPPSNTVVPGIYDCTSGGMMFGSVNFQGNSYTTDDHASGTYVLNPTTGAIAFTGGDLGDFTGTYDPSGPSMDLSSASGTMVHCAQ